jgi:hypothetical protein
MSCVLSHKTIGALNTVDWYQLWPYVVEASKRAGGPPGWIRWHSDSVDLVDSYLCRVQHEAGHPGIVQLTSIELLDTLCLDVIRAVVFKELSSKIM